MTAYVQDAIVLFGDSITQGGWAEGGIAQRLACRSRFGFAFACRLNVIFSTIDGYARIFDIVNRGFSGYNTDWAIPVLEQVTIQPDLY